MKSLNNPDFVPFQISFLTLFPEVFPSVLNTSLLGKAQKKGLIQFQTIQIRDFAKDRHRSVDDSPYGGGEGMVLKADVLYDAWKSLQNTHQGKTLTVLLSPQGRLFDQETAHQFVANFTHLILVCGHYEGVDERFIEECVDQELSIGDYILTGGELPALVVADTISRLIPGVVGNEASVSQDSLENGLLKHPQYTRPPVFQDRLIPEVLLQGNHQHIQKWRMEQSLQRTRQKRPDLWAKYCEKQKKSSIK